MLVRWAWWKNKMPPLGACKETANSFSESQDEKEHSGEFADTNVSLR